MTARALLFPSNRFEAIVVELFNRLGYIDVKTKVSFEGSLWHDYEVTVFGTTDDVGVIEVKYYRYASPPSLETFLAALHQARLVKQETGARRALLVISCPKTPGMAVAVAADAGIELWDAHALFDAARPFRDLVAKLEDLFEVPAPSSTSPAAEEVVSQPEGRRLSSVLRDVPRGKTHSAQFEDACIDAIRHLFLADLHGWHVQSITEDRLHRRDLVCRILPRSEVWQFMMTDLRSRYVVFEFKNYSSTITQKEVVTTEKYLYPAALRTVAIIVSPKGSSKSANKLIQGAMREHGKLILSLDIEDVCALLEGKDSGMDPNVYLFDRVDSFMMSLGR